jgi:heptaprenyl diphosphate synthase
VTPLKKTTGKLTYISLLSAFGLVLFVFESFLPLLPWFRPGLGNIATILALMFLGFGEAIEVTVLRIVIGALVLGRLFSPVFVLAISGGLASAFVMAFAWKYTRKIFGPVGISVLGAVVHNVVQMVIAYFIFVKSVQIFIFTPVFVFVGVVTGILTGIIAALIYERLGKNVRFEK